MNVRNEKGKIKRRILLVEGNHLNIRIMSRLLQGMDIEVVEATNGEEALKFAVGETFSMIFMCGFMPEITGYKTTKKIRELSIKNKNIPIIAVSSNLVNTLTEKMINFGISDIISKPLIKEEVDSLFLKHVVEKISLEKEVSLDFSIFNVEDFESFYDDKGLRKEIVLTFINEKENDTKRVVEAFKSKKIEKIYEALHYMKGSFIYLKAQSLVVLTQNLLDLLKAKNLNEALLLKKTFFQKYNLLLEELSAYSKTI